jgi:alpha-L-fucosidase
VIAKIDERSGGNSKEMLRWLIRAAGTGAAFIVRIAPGENGSIPLGPRATLEEMGRWLGQHKASVFETGTGPVAPADWGVSTRRENKVYLHYLVSHGGTLVLPVGIGNARSAYNFDHGAAMDLIVREGEYTLEIPSAALDPIDTIIVLEMDEP